MEWRVFVGYEIFGHGKFCWTCDFDHGKLCQGMYFLFMENFVKACNFWLWKILLGHVIFGPPDDGSKFVLQNLKSRGSLQMLKGIWEILSPNIKNIINEAGFQTFFQALLNYECHEYKDLQLLLALLECFWDTMCTFHFLGIGEVMLTPYDISVITGLRLGGERIKVNDFLLRKRLRVFQAQSLQS